MRIAIVVPWVWQVRGNRLAFSLAKGLAAHEEVVVFVELIQERIIDEVRRQLSPAELRFLRTTWSGRVKNWRLLVRQLARAGDSRISQKLRQEHAGSPFDWVICFANEGHWIGQYVSRWSVARRPRTGLVMMDPIDQIFLLARDRPNPGLRKLFTPLYPMLHRREASRIESFDRLFSISRWVSQLCVSLYGREPAASLAAVDAELFRPSIHVDGAKPYIAVPTVSVGPKEAPLLRSLFESGLPLITYGPRGLPGIPHRGFLSDPDLVSFLQGARLTLFLFDYEGLGLVPIESLAVGTPVVTQPRGGPWAELSGNRFVRFADDPAAVLSHCQSLLSDPKTISSVGEIRSSVTDLFASEVSIRWMKNLES